MLGVGATVRGHCHRDFVVNLICPGLNSSTKFTKTAKIHDYRNFRKICSSC